MRAHPRSRGEHTNELKPCGSRMGSSPLARGTRYDMVFTPPKSGLIPARAGNTPRVPLRRAQCRAHPRSRGEHRPAPADGESPAGSSPLARGTLARAVQIGVVCGLIPARAGNTESGEKKAGRYGAHPRSRGEHCGTAYQEHFHWGSSPLAQGTRWEAAVIALFAGLIPARAGNTNP